MQSANHSKKFSKQYKQKSIQQSFSQTQIRSYNSNQSESEEPINPFQKATPTRNSKITHKTIYGEKHDFGKKLKEKKNYILYVSGTIQDKKEIVEVEEMEEKKPIQQIFSKKELIDNYKYHESKYIKKKNPNKYSITYHERLSKPFERNIYSRVSSTTKNSSENRLLSNISSAKKISHTSRVKSNDWNDLLKIEILEHRGLYDKNNNKNYENNVFDNKNNSNKKVFTKKVFTKTINKNQNTNFNDNFDENYNYEFNEKLGNYDLNCKSSNNKNIESIENIENINFNINGNNIGNDKNIGNNKNYISTYRYHYRSGSYDESLRNPRKEKNDKFINYNNAESEEFENHRRRKAKSRRTCACGKIRYY